MALRDRIRRVARHLHAHPDDRKAVRVLDRLLKRKRTVETYIDNTDT